jgi:hypothetical protein
MAKVVVYVRFFHQDKHYFTHFMNYYLDLGVYKICVNVNYRFEEDKAKYEAFLHYVKTSRYAEHLVITTGPNGELVTESKHVKAAQESAIALCDLDTDFIIPADSDELHQFPDTLPNIIKMMNDEKIDYLDGQTLEKVSVDGSCPPVLEGISLFQQFPRWNHKLFRCPKIGIIRAQYAHYLSVGHHMIEPNLNLAKKHCIETHHFRWNYQGRDRVENWIRTWRNPKYTGWKDMVKYARMLECYCNDLLFYNPN